MSILTITVNPALDLTTDVQDVESGYKLRCGPARLDPGGGGVNVSRAIARLGGRSIPCVAIGGPTGEIFKSLLEAEGLAPRWFAIAGMTRQSVVVNERSTGKQFRFVLPGPEWSAAEADRALAALDEIFKNEQQRISYAVVSGSLPPGLPDDFYQRIGALAAAGGTRTVLDTSGRELDMAAHGSQHPPYIWIMDQGEAEHVADSMMASLDDLELFGRALRARDLAEIVILTYADGGSVTVSRDEVFRTMPPKVEVVSKVGAGDSFVGGLVKRLADGAPLREAVAYAAASAASAVTQPATSLCDAVQTERYFTMILDQQR